ncbi:GAF domain-containing protein [Pedobacter psychrotolerans]|uniref:histidine kinase n=1 Tax=Pedobacter psychrotolerans TaxID=1843235 RepID=A0A4R2H6A3_9SPHI|nr:PAS domain-containing protein [Pedobacter psychrotolerans]TCO21610.1 GAF domain-containing protein [Pedobacter psychrotolerans]GGE39887.1 hypothetical protein GCM10011413_01970 [Pedobacter psychrotolerans]
MEKPENSASENDYKAFFENSAEAYVLLEVSHENTTQHQAITALSVNRSARNIFGNLQIGEYLKQLNTTDWDFDAFCHQVAKSGNPDQHIIQNKDTEQRVQISAFKFGENNPAKVAIRYEDVSEKELKKLKTNTFQQSEKKFQHYVIAGSSMVYNMSADWKKMYMLEGNDTLDDTKFINENWLEKYIPHQDHDLVLKHIALAIEKKINFELEHRVILADGKIGWVHSRAVPLFDHNGKITEWFGTGVDITGRRLAETLLRESERRYRDSTRKYHSLFNSIDQGFCLIEMLFNEEGTATDYLILETNLIFEVQTGLSGVIGKTMKSIAPNHETYWYQRYGEVALSGKPKRFEAPAAALNRIYEAYAFAIGEQSPYQVAVLFNDITERKKSESIQSFLLSLGDELRFISDPVNVEATACRLLGNFLGANQVHYGQTQGDLVVIKQGWSHILPPLVGKFPYQNFGKHLVAGYRAGLTQVSNDISKDPLISPVERQFLSSSGFHAYLAVPLIKEEVWVATLAVHSIEARKWTLKEIQLVEEVAQRTWAAVERAAAEERLKLSEQHLKSMLNIPQVGVLTLDFSGKILSANDAFLEMIKYARVDFEFKKHRWFDFVNSDVKASIKLLSDVQQSGIGGPLEVEVQRSDDTQVWLIFTAAALGDGTLVTYAVNINERKIAEQKLVELNEHLEQEIAKRTMELQENLTLLQTVYNTTLVGMSVFKPVRNEQNTIIDFEIVTVNKKIQDESGKNDLVGQLYTEVFPGIRETGIFDLMVKTIQTGIPGNMEYHYNFDGVNKWYATMFVKGEDILVSTNLDITDRVIAEQQRLRDYILLQQSEELSLSGSWDYQVNSNDFKWSDGMYKLFSIAPGTAIAPEIYLKYATKESLKTAQKVVDLIKNGREDFEETISLHINGKYKLVRLKGIIAKSTQDHAVRVLGVDIDITALRESENKLRRLEMRQQQEILRVMLTTQEQEQRRISESLHNGVGQLLYGTQLSMNHITAKMAFEDLTKFNDSRNYTAKLLGESIKETRRISHELMPTALAEFGLKAAIEEACSQLTEKVEFHCMVALKQTKLDTFMELAIFRTLQELMVNVVKHAEATRCDVIVLKEESNVLITVRDNGKGMHPKLHQPGIGISSIKSKVLLLKGTIKINSRPGEGTQVRISLPYKFDI